MPNLMLTRHARATMLARGVTFDELEAAVARPEIVEPDKDGRKKFKRGDLCVVCAEGARGLLFVVTVLWRRQHQWTSDEMRAARV